MLLNDLIAGDVKVKLLISELVMGLQLDDRRAFEQQSDFFDGFE